MKLKSLIREDKLTSSKTFEEFLRNIDKMSESEIKKIMGNDYIDTPGDYHFNQMMRAGRNISRYYRDNMGNNEYEKLKKWYNSNKKRSLKEDSAGNTRLLKDIEIELSGKKIKLRKGQNLTHKRLGPFGPDYYFSRGIKIPAELIPDKYLDTFN